MRASTFAVSILSLVAGAVAEPAVIASGTGLTTYNTATSTRTVFMVTTQTRTSTPSSLANSTSSFIASSSSFVAPVATGGASGANGTVSASGTVGTGATNTAVGSVPPSPVFTGAAIQNAFPTAIAAIAAGAAMLVL